MANSKQILLAVIKCCGIFLILACDSEPTGSNLAVGNLIPLDGGNEWRFTQTLFNSRGNVIDTEADSIVLIADTTLNEQRWFYREYHGHHLAYRNTGSGVQVRLVSEHTSPQTQTLYKYPARIGDRFNYPEVYFSGDSAWIDPEHMLARVVSVDTLITVPAGTFRCYQYRLTDRELNIGWRDEFISPQYGWIMKARYSQEGNKLSSTELIHLKID